MSNLQIFVTGHKGFETLLFHELRDILSIAPARLQKVYGGVRIDGGIEAAYRVCLYSRLANRVFCELACAKAEDEAQLYAAANSIDWSEHFTSRESIAVSASLSRSHLAHGQFVAQRTKDAIVDQFRDRGLGRPTVERRRPDIQVHVNIRQNRATISLDLAGESLHRRGYRTQHAGAPLKEHLAAALLMQSGWTRQSAGGRCLIDPMCGSGTFAIEAAMIAADIAPGQAREYFAFKHWRRHRPDLWQSCVDEARSRVADRPTARIYAADRDGAALEIARANAARAGVSDWIEFAHCPVDELEIADLPPHRLVICNPPYGRRLHSEQSIGGLYQDLGDAVRRLAPARLAIISANPESFHRLQLTQVSRKAVRNGPLDCVFAVFESDTAADAVNAPGEAAPNDAAAEPLRNRLAKNARHLERWAKRNGITCYRLYDADLPEFAFALDRYQSEIDPEVAWFHLQEYQAPASVEPELAHYRITLAADIVRQLFTLPPERLFCKVRSRQKGKSQYQKQAQRNEFYQVREGPASLLVNLSDYLDTGLFLDHRDTRAMIHDMARDKSVLNLFSYTGSVGVMAALGGARSVLNVDLSATYLDWARENFRLNGLVEGTRFGFLRADIVELLQHPRKFSLSGGYDLIFFDPPSFSNSSKMSQTLDIQRDHAGLIDLAMRLLARGGLLLFSTNRRGFRLAPEVEERFEVNDISRKTIPEDFKRNPGIHRCWQIRHPA